MKIKTILLHVVAILAGYIAMVLLITLVQEVIFGGVSYSHSGFIVLAIAGLGTFLSAVAGGFVAARISNRTSYLPQTVMSAMVVVETTYLLSATDLISDPLWFDILAASSLIVGIFAGGYLWNKILRKRYNHPAGSMGIS